MRFVTGKIIIETAVTLVAGCHEAGDNPTTMPSVVHNRSPITASQPVLPLTTPRDTTHFALPAVTATSTQVPLVPLAPSVGSGIVSSFDACPRRGAGISSAKRDTGTGAITDRLVGHGLRTCVPLRPAKALAEPHCHWGQLPRLALL